MEPGATSRRKTFTVEAPLGSPKYYSNDCNRTFITGGDGMGGGERRELHNITVDRRLPLPDSSIVTGGKKIDQSIVIPGPSVSLLAHQRHNASLLTLPNKLPSSSSTSLFPFGPIHYGHDERVRRLLAKSSGNCRKLNGLIPDNGVSLADLSSASGGELFETTTVEATIKKPGLELEQLRIKEKALLDDINRVKSTALLYEKEQKATLKQIGADIKGMEKKIANLKKQKKEIKAETTILASKNMETCNQTTDIKFQVDLKNDFLRKFLKVDSDYKCTNSRFCKEFHKDGTCFVKPTS